MSCPITISRQEEREYKGNYLELGEEDILVMEGIHGLNDRLSKFIPKESCYKVYISALTQLNVDEHNRIPTTDGRLIRRMVRDNRTRATSARETIAMWHKVRRGEEKIYFSLSGLRGFCFQFRADLRAVGSEAIRGADPVPDSGGCPGIPGSKTSAEVS